MGGKWKQSLIRRLSESNATSQAHFLSEERICRLATKLIYRIISY